MRWVSVTSVTLLLLVVSALAVNSFVYSADTSSTTALNGKADALVNIDYGASLSTSLLLPGVTHIQNSIDSWADARANARAQRRLSASAIYQNQHIYGFGTNNPEPSPGVYDWSRLDERVELMRSTGAVMVITLCCTPEWMSGAGQYDAPQPRHYADYAELARQVALRYPDVQYYQVWNEMKGFWNSELNRWDYEGYTQMYNLIYDAVKSASPNARVGGPYVVIDAYPYGQGLAPSAIASPSYGVIDQRSLDVITYWLSHKRGADFITVDACTCTHSGAFPSDLFSANEKYDDVVAWIRARTSLPLNFAEWYSVPDYLSFDHKAAVEASAMMHFARIGVLIPFAWGPQCCQGDSVAIWTDTQQIGGGQGLPFATVARWFRDYFSMGTVLFSVGVSGPKANAIEVLASRSHQLIVNRTESLIVVSVINGQTRTVQPYGVALFS